MVLAAQPAWLDQSYRDSLYLEGGFLTGYSSVYVKPSQDANDLRRASRQFARLDLSESIALQVITSLEQDARGGAGRANTHFDPKSLTTNSLNSFGLVTEDYFDEETRMVYAFCYVSRKPLIIGYYKLLRRALTRARQHLTASTDMEPDQAYDLLQSGMYQVQLARGYSEMLGNLNVTDALILHIRDINALSIQYQERLKELQSKTDDNLDLALRFLVDLLYRESQVEDRPVYLVPPTYKNTGLATELTYYFHDRFKHRMGEQFEVVDEPEA